MKPVIVTKGITKTYQPDTIPVHALRGVDLTIDEGEFVAIVGPSGSGKSTFLRCINRLEVPEAGTIRVDGSPVGFRETARGPEQAPVPLALTTPRNPAGEHLRI